VSRVFGSYVQRFHPRLLVAAGLFLMAVGMGALAGFSQIPIVVAGAIAFGLGSSVLYPVVSAWVSEGLDPARRSGPQALVTTIFYAGLYAMPYPLSFLVAPAGYRATEGVLAVIGFTVASLVLASHMVRKKD
jgi:MFS family permease